MQVKPLRYAVPPILILLLATVSGKAQCPVFVDAGPDLYQCHPVNAQFQIEANITGDHLSFQWSPPNGLTGAHTLNPQSNATQTTSYVLTATAVNTSVNVIYNGDFELGNVGFSTDYTHTPGSLLAQDAYDVLTNPQAANPGFSPCGDHTSGGGNMMAINGGAQPGMLVWTQTVPVTPNTAYVFSGWATAIRSGYPPVLQVSINGDVIGSIAVLPAPCTWRNLMANWNSGANSSAVITIVNISAQPPAKEGNNFAIDDLVLAPTCTVTDTVTVHALTVTAVAAPQQYIIPCNGSPVTLSGQGSSIGPNVTYLWDTPNGNIVSGANTLNPIVDQAGSYTLSVFRSGGDVVCERWATVNVIENQNPILAWITPPAPLGCNGGNLTLIGNTNQFAFAEFAWSAGPGGNIVSGENDKNCVVNATGAYTLTVTNKNTGCTNEATVQVVQSSDTPVAKAGKQGDLNCINAQTLVSGAGSSSGPAIAYQWSALAGGQLLGPTTNLTATAGTPGLYVLSVTNQNNQCVTTDTVAVLNNLALPVVAIDDPDILNCQADTLTLQAQVTPSNAAFVWSTNQGNFADDAQTLTPKVNAPGLYILQTTHPTSGCIQSDTLAVNQDIVLPVALIQPAGDLTCVFNTATLDAVGSSAGSHFSYQWSTQNGNIVSGAQTLQPVVNAAGLYTLRITNQTNHCVTTASVQVVADNDVVTAAANAPGPLTCAATSIALSANGSTSGPNIIYQWSTDNGLIISGADTPNPTIGSPGAYALFVANTQSGCISFDTAFVVEDIASPELLIPDPDILTCIKSSQILSVEITPPGGDYAVVWVTGDGNITSGETSLNPEINAPGLYEVTVTNLQNGCVQTASASVNLEAGTPVAAIAMPPALTCAAQTVTLDAGASSQGQEYSFHWSSVHPIVNETSLNPSVSEPGVYQLTVVNEQNGCSVTTEVLVAQDLEAPPADAGPSFTLNCQINSALLVANGGAALPHLSYSWFTPNGHNIPGITHNAGAPGLYVLTVVNTLNGCSATASVQVLSDHLPPDMQTVTPDMLTCLQPTVTLSLSGNHQPQYIYLWTTPNGNITSWPVSPTVNVNMPGLYQVEVFNTQNRCEQILYINVLQENTPPDISLAAAPELTCAVTNVTLQAQNNSTGSFVYAWTNSTGQTLGADLWLQVDAPGNYLFEAVNTDNGCSVQSAITVTQDISAPTADAGPTQTLTCDLNSLLLQGVASGVGPLSYQWTTSNGVIQSGANLLVPTIAAPGQYHLLVTQTTNNCTASASVSVLEDMGAPQVQIQAPATLTCMTGQTALSATVVATPSISLQWSTPDGLILSGANTPEPLVGAPGTYMLTVVDASNGCSNTQSVQVNADIVLPTLLMPAAPALTCVQESATLSVTVSGAGGNVSYVWSGPGIVSGVNSPTPEVNQAGVYSVVVVNLDNGCSATAAQVVASDQTPPQAAIQTPADLNCLLNQTALQAEVSPVGGAYTYLWSSANGQIISGGETLAPVVGAAGLYHLTVVNQQNGCVSQASVTVNADLAAPQVQIAAPGVLTCANPALQLDATASTAPAGALYQWTAGSGGQIIGPSNQSLISINAAGVYTLLITNPANGCTAVNSIAVSANQAPPSLSIAQPGLLTCTVSQVSLQASSSVGSATYVWTSANGIIVSGAQTASPTVSAAGVYEVQVVNPVNGCTATASTTVTQNIVQPTAIAGPDQTLHCNAPQVTLQALSDAGPRTYQWSLPGGTQHTGQQLQASAPGVYMLTVINATNGCQATDYLTVNETLPPTFTPTLWHPDCLYPYGDLDFGPVTDGQEPFTYSLNGGASFNSVASAEKLAPGAYLLVVRDAYGCTAEAQAVFSVPAPLTLSLDVHPTLYLGDSVRLTSQSNRPVVSWAWSPGEYLSCTDCPAPWARPLRNMAYQVVVTDAQGCTASASVPLRVNRERRIYVPNVFAPGTDGENSRFTIFGKGAEEVENLRVYDRWGNQLFEALNIPLNDLSYGWDGSFRGQNMNPGVFVWMAVVRFPDGAVEVLSGDVTLVR